MPPDRPVPSKTDQIAADLGGRRALVTGGGSGIGRAIAAALARHGVQVALADIDRDRAAQVADEIGAVGAVAMDVRRRDSVQAGFEAALELLGGCDILCANAGVSTMNRAVDLTDEEWDFNFDVNARGVFLTNQIVARHFLAQPKDAPNRGVIVNTASLAAKVGAPLLAHYSASKIRGARLDAGAGAGTRAAGVRVNAVCPGFVRTAMQTREVEWEAQLRGLKPEQVIADYVAQTPLGRLEEPEDVADLVVFLCSSGARFMTGQGVNVTGGRLYDVRVSRLTMS